MKIKKRSLLEFQGIDLFQCKLKAGKIEKVFNLNKYILLLC